mgnify:CR=1 FL=1
MELTTYSNCKKEFISLLTQNAGARDKWQVFCDFVETLNISKNMRHEFAMTFWDCYKYNLNNVILPYWLLIYLIVVDGIGKD